MRAIFVPSRLVISVLLASTVVSTGEENPGQRYLLAASKEGVPPLNKNVYEELAIIHRIQFYPILYSDYVWPPVQPIDPSRFQPSYGSMNRLYEIGIDSLPVLAEALDDVTPSKTTKMEFRSTSIETLRAERAGLISPHKPTPWKVNELVGMAIINITGRNFIIVRNGEKHNIYHIGKTPELVPRFQKLVLDWYAKNAKKTVSQRMIDDLRDEFPENRSLAIRWIAYNKDKAGQAAIVKRAEEILADKNTIDSQANELADCALALGILGDAGNLDLVKRICKHFMSFAQVNDLSGPECNCNQLFRAYRGLALLGKKEEALTELERLYDHYSAHWEEGYFKIYHDKSEAIRSGKDIKPIDWVR